MGSVTDVQEGTLENVDAPMGTPVPAAVVSSPHGGEDTESTKEVGEEAGQPPKREFTESSVPEVDSVPTKKLKEDLSERIPALLVKVEEGFSLTGEARQSVKQHLELHRQVAMDLQNLASEYHQDRTSSKYSLAQIQSLIEKMSMHTSLKQVAALPEGVPAAPSVETGNLEVEAKESADAGERNFPVETEEGKRTEINAEGENEPPNKRPTVELEDEIRELLSKVTEGFSLTKSALEKVQQHLDLSKATSSDLSQLAAEFHHETVSAKYSLSQIQALLTAMQNLDWQLTGSKSESHTTVKSILNKLLNQNTNAAGHLKAIRDDLKGGLEAILKALTEGFGDLSTAFAAAGIAGMGPGPGAAAPSVPQYGQPDCGSTGSASGFPPAPVPPMTAAGKAHAPPTAAVIPAIHQVIIADGATVAV
ncbi:unnamed protein product [Cladocopium goreaui]|uniref:Uncharacterized protein n=1 Tax=Cladocopium goreaui TaxID=2562237 RepID=A0A9P1DEU9_9DINO|nr:unnamed protein product [Cladocopium goreaui]